MLFLTVVAGVFDSTLVGERLSLAVAVDVSENNSECSAAEYIRDFEIAWLSSFK